MNTEIGPSIPSQPSDLTKTSQRNTFVASDDIQRAVSIGTEQADSARLRRPGAKRNQNLRNSFTSSSTSVNDHRHASGTAAAVGNGRGKGGLFPFRRRTLCTENVSHSHFQCSRKYYLETFAIILITFNAPLISGFKKDPDVIDSCSISNFHQVFNEVKAENPLAAMGAVQQITVRRLSQLQKLQKEQQEELNRLAQDAQDDERKTGLAAKALNKFVDIIRVGPVAPVEGEDHGIKATGPYSSRPAHKSHLDDSFVSSSSSDCAHDKTLPIMKFAGFRRNSASAVNRESSQLSSAQSTFSEFNSSNDSLTLTKPRTANEMYAIAANEQGENMALMRSVDDFSVMLSVGDLSRRSGDSLISNMSGLILAELTKSAQDTEAEADIRDGNAYNGSFDSDCVDDFVLATCFDSTIHTSSGLADNRRQDQEKMIEWSGLEKATKTPSKFANSNIRRIDETDSCQADARSALSGLSDCTSACGSDGLIVGFPLRCENSNASSDNLLEDNDECVGLEGFAADFSAWDNRSEG
ncbi:hypothetical protein HJC23_009443 [Cyclotella cryptica]|uniref:Uncharacterized protein n=1 Tax=Cyclotella cryptica TaxID=29204 RepID=A0ABD3Q0R6_9STRA